MNLVTEQNTTRGEYPGFTLIAEASELGLRPGEWPQQLSTNLGNSQPFCLELQSSNLCRYRQSLGCLTLDVFND